MTMKRFLAALLVAAPFAAPAQPGSAPGPGYHERLYERYCEKLRESPEAYVQFVKRMRVLHGYTFEDFAPREPGAEVVANCRLAAERVAKAKGGEPATAR